VLNWVSQAGEKYKGSLELVQEMIIIHNLMLRGVNSIVLQCENVERSPADVDSFVHYAQTWGQLVSKHHKEEEEVLFPSLEELLEAPGLMAGNVEQHESFHGGLDQYDAHLQDVLDGKQQYDGKKLRGILEGLMPALRTHLSDEIHTLLALQKYDDKADLSSWFQKTQKEILGRGNTAPNLVRFTADGGNLCVTRELTLTLFSPVVVVRRIPPGLPPLRQQLGKRRLGQVAPGAVVCETAVSIHLHPEAQELVAVRSVRWEREPQGDALRWPQLSCWKLMRSGWQTDTIRYKAAPEI